jgi:nickel superoxide dismutase
MSGELEKYRGKGKETSMKGGPMNKRMHKPAWWLAMITLVVVLGSGTAFAHCEIPCGIYDDQMRVHMIAEHIKTIEKSMKEVKRLVSEEPMNKNQIVRWIMNKEDHANQLQEIVTQYFMTQRIKPDTEKYTEKLTVLHKMMIYAMKCKQTTDVGHVATLRSLLDAFSKLYFPGDEGHGQK